MSEILEALKGVEWSGYIQGPGSGPMFSGGDGVRCAACPECGGLRESHPGLFTETAVGHRENCKLGNAIRKLEGGQ